MQVVSLFALDFVHFVFDAEHSAHGVFVEHAERKLRLSFSLVVRAELEREHVPHQRAEYASAVRLFHRVRGNRSKVVEQVVAFFEQFVVFLLVVRLVELGDVEQHLEVVGLVLLIKYIVGFLEHGRVEQNKSL